ncbi:hypothetical protein OSTOST_09468 [Ostertagia ostertagi]
MTESIANKIRTNYPGFIIEERGLVDVKGKGPVFTCFLTGCIGSRQSPEFVMNEPSEYPTTRPSDEFFQF